MYHATILTAQNGSDINSLAWGEPELVSFIFWAAVSVAVVLAVVIGLLVWGGFKGRKVFGASPPVMKRKSTTDSWSSSRTAVTSLGLLRLLAGVRLLVKTRNDLSTAFPEVMIELAEAFTLRRAMVIYAPDGSDQGPELRASWGRESNAVWFPEADMLIVQAIADHHRHQLRNGETVQIRPETQRSQTQRAWANAVLVPIQSGQEYLGFLALERHVQAPVLTPALLDAAGILSSILEPVVFAASRSASNEQAHVLQSEKMEAVGHLARGIAHDFNNLLTAIHGYLTLARGALHPEHPASQSLEHVAEAARQATVVTNTLLAFSRRDGGGLEVVPATELVESALTLFKRTLPPGVTIEYNRIGSPSFWVQCDSSQLQQALLALVTNAAEAMPKGGRILVELADIENPAGVRWSSLSVTDTGRGMAPDVRRRVFEPFFTTKSREHHAGLGLSIAQSIVQRLGGLIDVETAPEEGSRFRIIVPGLLQPVTQVATPSVRTDSRGTAVVVEDHQLVRALIATMLTSEGFSVIQADSCGEAELLSLSTAALLVVDIELPDLNGLEWVGTLRKKGVTAPMILVTGGSDRVLDLGHILPAFVIRKPFQASIMSDAVRRLLSADAEPPAPQGVTR